MQVRFATHASAIELHGLDEFASNEYIEAAMSLFGTVERSVIVCDDRGRSKGYAVVEFGWKKSAQKVLDRLKEEMFVLGRYLYIFYDLSHEYEINVMQLLFLNW